MPRREGNMLGSKDYEEANFIKRLRRALVMDCMGVEIEGRRW